MPSQSRPRLYVFVHVPKNAGASFMKDAPFHLPKSVRLRGSREKAVFHAYTQMLLSEPGARLVVLIRDPVRLAYFRRADIP